MLDGTTRRYGLLTTAVLVRDGRCDPLAWLRPVQSLQPPGRHLWRPDAGLPVYATFGCEWFARGSLARGSLATNRPDEPNGSATVLDIIYFSYYVLGNSAKGALELPCTLSPYTCPTLSYTLLSCTLLLCTFLPHFTSLSLLLSNRFRAFLTY